MINNLNNYEVLIAGAGPSGCASAIILASEGVKVAIIDEVNPGFKIGESLPSAAIRLLGRIGINGLNQILSPEEYSYCAANVSAWGSEEWEYMDALKNPEGGGWHLVRESFDKALRKLALEKGVDFFEGKASKIKRVETNTIQYRVSFREQKKSMPAYLNSEWLIDATGRPSALLKQLNIERKTYQDQLAAVCWLKPMQDDEDHTTRIKSIANGWVYSAQLPDGNRVLVQYGLPDSVAELVRDPSLLIKSINSTDILNYKVQVSDLATPVKATKAGLSKAEFAIGENW